MTGSLLVVAAIVVVFGPWWLSLVRDLMAERQARARAEERAQMAAHVHDSVLQTLALIQRSADDPKQVVRLARAQERELRSWLFDGRPPGRVGDEATTLAEGIGALQRQVEADHGITVQIVVVGDCPLTTALRALLDAAREATVNSAKWSGAPEVSLYAEVEPDSVAWSSSATVAADSTRPRSPATARASPSRSGPAWPASGERQSSGPHPARGPRWSCPCPARADARHRPRERRPGPMSARASSWSTTMPCSDPGCGPSSATRSSWWARPTRSTPPSS